ncbi:proton-conducting transporter membrane subunit [Candidatus Endowatersipora endosymbiont of Watersipora subatra]|uniref:proton-conducting transporter transmembrane domain-containing protein n=1 Tax=Candidatus Endowatersipora endosymbiont of Watersipora subatra TaxID=3077946 RepID=UPI00312C77B6
MSGTIFLLLSMIFPLMTTVLCALMRTQKNKRDCLALFAAVMTFLCVLGVLSSFKSTDDVGIHLINFQPELMIAFGVEPLGIVFALLASGFWIITHIYSIGYMRTENDKKHARFFAFFSFSIFSTLGIAYSSNLLTLFVFYELLTISTYPLVAHKETKEATLGARIYLGILMGTSIVFLLLAVIWTYLLTGTLDFVSGGILAGKTSPFLMALLLGFFAFGIAKAALMPFHQWLPSAMIAPTPVSALLHAVTVVKAGVFSMLKVGIYIFGIKTLETTGASIWLIWLSAFSILMASLIAMTKDNLKARLAYSTISQLSYITLGMALATSMGTLGGCLHIVTHAFGKITLFMCAGTIYIATKKTEISTMRGLGRTMPFTFISFGVAALSIIGLPPFGGSWSKWSLLVAAADVNQRIIIAVIMLSSILNVMYLIPVFARGFFSDCQPVSIRKSNGIFEAPLLCVLPSCLTASGCIVLFFYSLSIQDFLIPILTINN